MAGIDGFLNHKALVEYPTSEEVLKNVTDHRVDGLEIVDDNFFKGRKRVCVNNSSKFVQISVLVLKDCTDVAAFNDRIEALRVANPEANIIVILDFVDAVHNVKNPAPAPCIITEILPFTTLDAWLKTMPKLSSLTPFLRKLFSSLGKFHQKQTGFGNLLQGVRVKENSGDFMPVFAVPGRATNIDERSDAIVDDLDSIYNILVDRYKNNPSMHLFHKLVELAKLSQGKRSIKTLLEFSFIALHVPLVWNDTTDLYDFIVNLHLFWMANTASYEYLVSDNRMGLGYAGVCNWKLKIKEATSVEETFLYENYWNEGEKTEEEMDNTYSTTESIRYFARFVYSHLKAPHAASVESASKLLKHVFPELEILLYEMFFYRLYSGARFLPSKYGALPDIIEHFKTGAHCFRF